MNGYAPEYADGLLQGLDGRIRKPNGTCLRHACGTGIHCQRMGETRRTLRKRLAEYVSLCNDTGSRRHQYLRRMDEEREIRHDLV